VRFLGGRESDSDLLAVQRASVQGLHRIGCITCLLEGDEAKASGPTGATIQDNHHLGHITKLAEHFLNPAVVGIVA
jgi:hypothetical protein